MKILSIDTSTFVGSVVVLHDDKICVEGEGGLQRHPHLLFIGDGAIYYKDIFKKDKASCGCGSSECC